MTSVDNLRDASRDRENAGSPYPAFPRLHPAALPLAVLGLGVLALVYLWDHNPHDESQLMLKCPFHWATGLYCPSCGVTRMMYDLLHARWSMALKDNAALLLASPLIAAGYAKWLWLGLKGRRWRLRPRRKTLAALFVVVAAWFVLRNFVLGI